MKQSLTDPTAMSQQGIYVLSTFVPISEVLVPDNVLTDHLCSLQYDYLHTHSQTGEPLKIPMNYICNCERQSLLLKIYVNMNKRTFGSD